MKTRGSWNCGLLPRRALVCTGVPPATPPLMSLSLKLVSAVCGKYSPVAESFSQVLGFRHPLGACPYVSKCIQSYYHQRSKGIFMLVRFTCVFLLMLGNCEFKNQIRRLGYWLQNWKTRVMQSVRLYQALSLASPTVLCVLFGGRCCRGNLDVLCPPKSQLFKVKFRPRLGDLWPALSPPSGAFHGCSLPVLRIKSSFLLK